MEPIEWEEEIKLDTGMFDLWGDLVGTDRF